MSVVAPSRPALDLRSLLEPRSIAIIGASSDEGRHNGRPIANLLRTGYRGRIYPITARPGDVRGIPSLRRIADVPERVDLAYLLVRADLVPGLVAECAEAGVRNVVVNSSGFAEEGEDGARAQERLRDLAWDHGMRIVGPNCIGLLAVGRAVSVTTLNITVEQTPGDVAIVSQSGGMATNLFNRAQGEGVGVRAMVSLGNEADVDVADVVDALADDEETATILLYVEELRDVGRFRAAVARARGAGKVVAAVKTGRTAAGARSAQSHTGAMAGSYAVFRDLVAAMGVVVLEGIDGLVDLAKLRQRGGAVAGRRILVVSPSGGECGYLADLVEGAGLEMPELSTALAAALGEVMRFGMPSNPLDLTGQVIGDDALLGRVFAAIDASAEFDAVVVALPTWGPFDSARLMPAILAAAEASGVPMIVTAWRASGLTETRDAQLRRAPIAAFDDAARAVRAIAASAAPVRRAPRALPEVAPIALDPAALVDEAAAKRWLASAGVPVSAEHIVPAGEPVRSRVGFPVVAKGVVPGVAHKSEYGLVQLDVRDDAELSRAAERIEEAARAHALDLSGVLVARAYAGVELIAGVVEDAAFGKVLMVGAGGVLAELLDDTAFLACPAAPAEVRDALAGLRVARLLDGYRGRECDVEALVHLLVRVSEVAAACDEIAELDLNPIVVGAPGEGAVVVDALVRARPADADRRRTSIHPLSSANL